MHLVYIFFSLWLSLSSAGGVFQITHVVGLYTNNTPSRAQTHKPGTWTTITSCHYEISFTSLCFSFCIIVLYFVPSLRALQRLEPVSFVTSSAPSSFTTRWGLHRVYVCACVCVCLCGKHNNSFQHAYQCKSSRRPPTTTHTIVLNNVWRVHYDSNIYRIVNTLIENVQKPKRN